MRFQVGLMYVWGASPTNLSYQFRVVHKIIKVLSEQTRELIHDFLDYV